eukprot:759321-Hanusia_phi.AAC.3
MQYVAAELILGVKSGEQGRNGLWEKRWADRSSCKRRRGGGVDVGGREGERMVEGSCRQVLSRRNPCMMTWTSLG